MTTLLRVEEPGLYTTIQDLGRPNAIAAGVPAGGAIDRFAHSAANLLVGNDVSAATLECTLSGPHLHAERPCVVAVTGADFDLRVNGSPAPMWTGLFLGEGDHLTFGFRRFGARAYVALAGGVAADRWLGSLSTNVMAARGGMHGRILARGDSIAAAVSQSLPAVSGRELQARLRPDYSRATLHALPGPHLTRLGPEGRRRLFESPFTVSRDADRMGYRLDGPQLDMSGEELLSFGLVAGAVQVPARGQPILLMADHQTAGGYPVAAIVVSASMPVAAQLLPGALLNFVETSIDIALRMRRGLSAALATLR
jgi:antagonist of KipI